MAKIKYEVDPHNRLISGRTGKKTGLRRFRKVYDGKFKIGKNNSLIYHIKAPAQKDKNIPRQVKFKGKWSLSKNHDLIFSLDKWKKRVTSDKLALKGNIIDVNKNSLLFSLTTKTGTSEKSTYILKLAGAWQADKLNRLTFKAKRERSRYDILIFSGQWDVDKKQQIIYRYEKAQLIKKLKKIHTLIFKGHWDIEEKARISYVLDKTPPSRELGRSIPVDKNTNSVFNFRSSFGIFKDKYIKYTIGLGLSKKVKPIKKTIILFGAWKIKRNKGLTFEVKYRGRKVYSMSFGAEARLTKRDSISFKLKNDIDNKDIGVNLKLSRKILKGSGEAFLNLFKKKRESAVFIGVGKRW